MASALFSHSGDALALLVQPIPMWAAVIGLVAFPVTMAVAELPTYYGFVFGTVRGTWLVPTVGVRVAELTELPFD